MNNKILQGKRVFLVEDNSANLAITKTLLEQQGAIVGIERWGRDTVEKLRSFLPADVVLLDLMYPNKVTGYDIFQQIREHEEFEAISVIAVSASDPGEAIPRTQDLGFDGFIRKPIDFDLFPRQILDVLSGEPVWR